MKPRPAAAYSVRMTLANLVTLARLALIPFVVATLAWGLEAWSFALLLAFFLGDLLDGYLARSRNEITPLGQFLDPLADKLLGFSLVVFFAVDGALSAWAVALLMLPNAALLLGTLRLFGRGRPTIPARASGKLAATVLAGGLTLLYLERLFAVDALGGPTVYAGIALSLVAAVDYVRVGLRAR